MHVHDRSDAGLVISADLLWMGYDATSIPAGKKGFAVSFRAMPDVASELLVCRTVHITDSKETIRKEKMHLMQNIEGSFST